VTLLETFRIANRIEAGRLARESQISRRHFLYLRDGRAEPTRPKMLAIRDACSRLLSRQVHLDELFDLGEGVAVVARWQGELFAEEWFRGNIDDACDHAGIIRWPDEMSLLYPDEELNRCHDLTEEITSRVFYDVKDTIAEAFVRVANDVLNRERRR